VAAGLTAIPAIRLKRKGNRGQLGETVNDTMGMFKKGGLFPSVNRVKE
jgi:hypothetical protein